jgi:DNA replication protein DnaC
METLKQILDRIEIQQANTPDLEPSAERTKAMRNLTSDEITAALGYIGVPVRYQLAKKEDIADADWHATLNYRSGKKEGLFLHSLPGRGKTHLAAALFRDKATRGKIPAHATFEDASVALMSEMAFITVTDLLLDLRATFKDGSVDTEASFIQRYTGVPFLILDDIGVEKTTDWALQTLYQIIDTRYRDLKKTVITSNLSLPEVETKVGSRIASRIAGMCTILELRGRDRRILK